MVKESPLKSTWVEGERGGDGGEDGTALGEEEEGEDDEDIEDEFTHARGGGFRSRSGSQPILMHPTSKSHPRSALSHHRRTSSSQSAAFQRARALRSVNSMNSFMIGGSGSGPNSPLAAGFGFTKEEGVRAPPMNRGVSDEFVGGGAFEDNAGDDIAGDQTGRGVEAEVEVEAEDDDENHEEAVDEVGEPVWRRPSHSSSYSRARGLSFNSTGSSSAASGLPSPEAVTTPSTIDYPFHEPTSNNDLRARGASFSSVSTDMSSPMAQKAERDRAIRHAGGSSASLRGHHPSYVVDMDSYFSPPSPEYHRGRRTSDSSSTTGSRGAATPLAMPLNIRNVSSHAQAQFLVQAAQDDILSADGTGTGALSLTEQLALYGGVLEIERRFARGEAQKERRMSTDDSDGEDVIGGDSRYPRPPISPKHSKFPPSDSKTSPARSIRQTPVTSRGGSNPLALPPLILERSASRGGRTRQIHLNHTNHSSSLFGAPKQSPRRPSYNRSGTSSDEEDDPYASPRKRSGSDQPAIIETLPTPTDSPASAVSYSSRLPPSDRDRETDHTLPNVWSRVVAQPHEETHIRTSDELLERYTRSKTAPTGITSMSDKLFEYSQPQPPSPQRSNAISRGVGSDWALGSTRGGQNLNGTGPRRRVGPADFDYEESDDARAIHKRFGGLKHLVQTLKGK